MADLQCEQAAWAECVVGLRDEPAIDGEAGFAGEECEGRFMVADLGMEGGAVELGDIRRVADDGVEPAGRYCGEQIGFNQVDPVCDTMRLRILSGDGQGLCGDINRGDFGVRKLKSKGDCENAGAGADVEYMKVLIIRELLEDHVDKMFCLGAGDEDHRGHVEAETVELLLTDDVLNGFAVGAAKDALTIGEFFFFGQLPVRR